MKTKKKSNKNLLIIGAILVIFALIIVFSQFTGFVVKKYASESIISHNEFYLNDLPKPFCNPDDYINVKGFYLLTGEDQSPEIVRAAGWIQQGFYDKCGKAPSTDVAELNKEYMMPIKRAPPYISRNIWSNGHLILIGQPCSNHYMADALGTKACDIAGGKGLIKIISSGETAAIIVTGSTSEDIQRAARVLQNMDYFGAQLIGTEIEVTGGEPLTDFGNIIVNSA